MYCMDTVPDTIGIIMTSKSLCPQGDDSLIGKPTVTTTIIYVNKKRKVYIAII